MATHNRAAFSRDDIADAERGYPDLDLKDYAAQRGLEFLDHATPAGFRAALPCDDELQSNVLRGTLPGGEHGVMAHEGLEIGFTGDSLDWGGTFHGIRVRTTGDVGGILGLVPVVNWFVGSSPSANVRVPCTVACVRVPETAGLLTHLRFDRRRSAPPFSFGERTTLGGLAGATGWDLYAGEKPDPQVVAQLAAGPVAALLRAHAGDGLFQAVVWWGTLVVRRNGFLRSPEELDELGRAASVLAQRLRAVCLSRAEPQPFDTRLPPLPVRRGVDAPPGFFVDPAWSRWATDTAARYELESEDPLAYHRAYPSLPVPGIARVVLRGTIPRLGLPGRLVVHCERGAARPAVLIAAAPGVKPTPPGGVSFVERGLRLQVAEGLLAAWSTTSYPSRAMPRNLDAFCAAAADTINKYGTGSAAVTAAPRA